MRPRRFALSLLASLSLAATPALADDPYAEYRIPEHYWRSWTANLQGSGNHQVSDLSFAENSRQGSLDGLLATQLLGGYDSDPRSSAYLLSLVATGMRTHSTETRSDPLTFFDNTDRERSAKEQFRASASFSRYPWSVPIGLTLGASGVGTLTQSWHSTARVDANTTAELRRTTNVTGGGATAFLTTSAAATWGRVRDATPVYQVQVLEQRLLASGTIQHPLSRAGRDRLASLYTTQRRVGFAHQRPDKYFWRELERVLSEDGVLSERGLDAYAVQRVSEPLSVTGTNVARTRGFALSPSVFLSMLQSSSSRAFEGSLLFYVNDTLETSSESALPRSRSESRDDGISTGLTIEYHRPAGPRWQYDGVSSASLTESGKTLFSFTGVSATWLVSDRWLATARLDHRLEAPGTGVDRAVRNWEVICGANVYYFLEDSWALQLGVIQDQMHTSVAYQRQESVSLGISYVVTGFLNAPAVFAPMRLSPPAN